jgi:hypothetical protein
MMTTNNYYGLVKGNTGPTEPSAATWLTHPSYDGIHLRTGWEDLQPEEDLYDWSYIDQFLPFLEETNQSFYLTVGTAGRTPDWAKPLCRMFTYTAKEGQGGEDGLKDMPIPWDTRYLRMWDRFLRALGTRYRSEPRLKGIQITGAAKGVEMYLPNFGDDPERLIAEGYTHGRLVGAYKYLIRSYAQHFPQCFKFLSFSSTVVNVPGEQNTVHEQVLEELLRQGCGVKLSYWQDTMGPSQATETFLEGTRRGASWVLEPASRTSVGTPAMEWATALPTSGTFSPYEEQKDIVLREGER